MNEIAIFILSLVLGIIMGVSLAGGMIEKKVSKYITALICIRDMTDERGWPIPMSVDRLRDIAREALRGDD